MNFLLGREYESKVSIFPRNRSALFLVTTPPHLRYNLSLSLVHFYLILSSSSSSSSSSSFNRRKLHNGPRFQKFHCAAEIDVKRWKMKNDVGEGGSVGALAALSHLKSR